MLTLLTVMVLGAAPSATFSPAPQDPVPTPVSSDADAEHGDEPTWVSDWEAAKAQAKKEGKDLLVDFTGSDWCGWCIKLHKEVFSHAAFSGPAAAQFVFVELDFPQQKEQSAELKEQNQKLQTQFAVEGFPTIFLTDADGLPYGQTGYQEGGPEKYLTHLGELREVRNTRDALTAKADGQKGVARAKLLADAIDVIPAGLQRHYLPWMEEIIALDADGKGGLKEKYEGVKRELALQAEIGAIKGSLNGFAQADKWGEGADKLESFLTAQGEALPVEARHELTYYAAIFRQRGGEIQKAIVHLEAAIKLIPEHPMTERLQQMLEQLKQQASDGGKGEGEKKDGDKKDGDK